MEKRLTIEEQREIIKQSFQKLKGKFLNKEQSVKVHLRELSEDYWLIHRPWSCGLTICYHDDVMKVKQMYFVVRLFYKHEKLDFLLDTVAHEFAHVYLNFMDPQIGHGKEHDK